MPDKVIERRRLLQPDLLLPSSFAFGNIGAPLQAALDLVFWIEHFDYEPPRARMRRLIRDRHSQDAVRVNRPRRLDRRSGLGLLECFNHDQRGRSEHRHHEEEDKPEIGRLGGWIAPA